MAAHHCAATLDHEHPLMKRKRYVLWASVGVTVVVASLLLHTLAVPTGWRQVKIGDERLAVIQRLGPPRIDGWDIKGDEWTKYTGIGCVAMRVSYRGPDDGDHATVRAVRWSHWIGCRDFHFRLRPDQNL